jgi:pimeloyl-ACP methyl ester carboxylesterase
MTNRTDVRTTSQPPDQPAAQPDHLLVLADGRRVAVDTTGPEAGPVVLFLHSAPGSRHLDPDPAATIAAGVRLVTVDRPGYGQSSPLPDGAVPSLAGMADDLVEVLDQLGIDEVAVAGWSSGGRVALALAAAHPDRVRSVALVGTPAPDEAVPWLGEHREVLAALAADLPNAVGALVEPFAVLAEEPEAALASVTAGGADADVLGQRDVRARLAAMLREAFRDGVLGVATDVVAVSVTPPGFDHAAIGAPVSLWYGTADEHITADHGRWWEGQLASADLRLVEGAGHLLPLTCWGEVLESLRTR